jgi:5'-nucleotidase
MAPMLKAPVSVVAALALPSCAGGPAAVAPSAPSAPACLSIVAWNDLHGQLGPDDPVVDTGRLPAGGVVALADQLAAVRGTGDTVVVLDAGDLFTGPLASTMAEGAPVIEAYRILGVDAAAIGNHEFDFGPAGYDRVAAPPGVGDEAGAAGPRGALLDRMAAASFPFLSANVHRVGGAPTGWRNHLASTRIRRDGFDVGVVGYTTRETPTTTLAANVAGLDFSTGAAQRVAAAVRELRAAGSAPVVLLAHASLEGELPQTPSDTAEHKGEVATLMAELGPDVPDLVVAGHRHAWMVGKVRGVPIVSNDQHGVGLARIRFCREGGLRRPVEIERRVAVASAPPRSELGVLVAAAMAPWEAKVRPVAEAKVTTIARGCSPHGPQGSAMADQIARATAEHASDAAAVPAGVPVVGLVNTGGVRAPLGAGVVRYGDVFTVFPFENAVAVCGTTRAGLVRVIQNAFGKDSARERFPFGIAGARLRVRRGEGGRLSLSSLEIPGEKQGAGPDEPVWLALSDFLLFGGDGLLTGVHCSPAVTSPTRIREAWRGLLSRGADAADRSAGGPDRSAGGPDRSAGGPDRSAGGPDRSAGGPDRSAGGLDRPGSAGPACDGPSREMTFE